MTLDILIVDEKMSGEAVAFPLRERGYSVDLHETPSGVDPEKDYGLLIIDPFECGHSFETPPSKDHYVDLIRNFNGKVYVTTTLPHGESDVLKIIGLKKGDDYDRFYMKPYDDFDLINDIATDFDLPENAIDLDALDSVD